MSDVVAEPPRSSPNPVDLSSCGQAWLRLCFFSPASYAPNEALSYRIEHEERNCKYCNKSMSEAKLERHMAGCAKFGSRESTFSASTAAGSHPTQATIITGINSLHTAEKQNTSSANVTCTPEDVQDRRSPGAAAPTDASSSRSIATENAASLRHHDVIISDRTTPAVLAKMMSRIPLKEVDT